MMELFDMGKYDFFVWSSIGVFIVALTADFISASSQKKRIKQQINAQIRKSAVRKTAVRRKQP